MSQGEAVIAWTARLMVACYVARLLIDAAARRDEPAQRWARVCWTAGCAIGLLHMTAAFHFLHHWSIAHAWEYTARRTFEASGWNSGIGLVINWAFLSLWVLDTAIWWYRLSWSAWRLPYWTVQAVFAFMMWQGTAGFGPAFWTPLASAIVLLLGAVVLITQFRALRRTPDTVRS